MECWYFAYGSNLSLEQMIARLGGSRPVERGCKIAHLANYRLVFQYLESPGPAFANIVSPGAGVFGVVYRCSPADLARLDHFECGYERRPIAVTDRQGESMSAVAYVVQSAQAADFGRPSAEYLDRIIRGARHHGLPEQYIDSIVASALTGPTGS